MKRNIDSKCWEWFSYNYVIGDKADDDTFKLKTLQKALDDLHLQLLPKSIINQMRIGKVNTTTLEIEEFYTLKEAKRILKLEDL